MVFIYRELWRADRSLSWPGSGLVREKVKTFLVPWTEPSFPNLLVHVPRHRTVGTCMSCMPSTQSILEKKTHFRFLRPWGTNAVPTHRQKLTEYRRVSGSSRPIAYVHHGFFASVSRLEMRALACVDDAGVGFFFLQLASIGHSRPLRAIHASVLDRHVVDVCTYLMGNSGTMKSWSLKRRSEKAE